MTAHFIETKHKMAKTLHEVQHNSSIDHYMTHFKTSTGDSSEEHNTWLCPLNVSKLTDNDLKEICLTKAKSNLLKFLYSPPFHTVS